MVPANPVYDPKFAIEFDSYRSTTANYNDPYVYTTHSGNDHPHTALVFWGVTYNALNQGSREDDAAHNYGDIVSPIVPSEPGGSEPTYAAASGYYHSTTDDYIRDSNQHDFRMDVTITANGANWDYHWNVCIDCEDCNDLTEDYTGYATTTTGHAYQWTETVANASELHTRMQRFWFGWTYGNGSGATSQVAIKNFGIKFRR